MGRQMGAPLAQPCAPPRNYNEASSPKGEGRDTKIVACLASAGKANLVSSPGKPTHFSLSKAAYPPHTFCA